MTKNINQHDYKLYKFIDFFIKNCNIKFDRNKTIKLISRLESGRIFLILILLNINNFIGFWSANFRKIIVSLVNKKDYNNIELLFRNITLEKIFTISKLDEENKKSLQEIYRIESLYMNLFLDNYFFNSIRLEKESFEKLKKHIVSEYYSKIYRYKTSLYITKEKKINLIKLFILYKKGKLEDKYIKFIDRELSLELNIFNNLTAYKIRYK